MKATGMYIQVLRKLTEPTLLGTMIVLLVASCGGQTKKPIEEVVELDEAGVGNSPPSGVASMKKSSGRYTAQGAKACPSSTNAWMQKMRKKVNFKVETTNALEQTFPDSGHFYLYEARVNGTRHIVNVHGSQKDSTGTVTKGPALENIGLQIQEKATEVHIFATSVNSGASTIKWGRVGVVDNAVTGFNMKLKTAGNFPNTSEPFQKLDIETFTGISDSELSNKQNAANVVLNALTSSSGFQIEYFSDPAANQILLLTANVGGTVYEAEFGREAQALKPLPCTGNNYTKCTNHSACKDL